MTTPITAYQGKSGAWTASRSKHKGRGKTKRAALEALNEVIDDNNAEEEADEQPIISDIFEDVNLYDEAEDGFLFEYKPITPHGKMQRMRLDADNYDSAVFEAAGILNVTEAALKAWLERDK